MKRYKISFTYTMHGEFEGIGQTEEDAKRRARKRITNIQALKFKLTGQSHTFDGIEEIE